MNQFALAFTPEKLQEAWHVFLTEFPMGLWETVYVTVLATFFAIVLGLPLGILLVTKLGFGLYGAWITLITDQMVRSFLIFRRYNSGVWINALADHKTH